MFAIGLPNFFEPKPAIVPVIIPIEIINVSDVTSVPEKIQENKVNGEKKIQVKEKKFNASDNQEIKKIDIKEKPKIKATEVETKVTLKEDNFLIKEKKEIPVELLKKEIEIKTNEFESIPSKKIKPKLKPKLKPRDEKLSKPKSDVVIKKKPKNDDDFTIASMLKDLRNEKSTPKIDELKDDENKKEDIMNKSDEKTEKESAQLSISEIDLVLQQLSRCFTAPAGAQIKKTMYVKISAKIQQNRRVLPKSIRIVDTNIPKSSTVYGPITESAMRTLLNPECIPLKLPEDKYDLWKNLTMKFDYSVMRGN